MGQSLFKKYSKFKKFNKILYCWMTRIMTIKLAVLDNIKNTKTILKKKNMGQNRFRKLSKFQKFH